MKGSDNRVINGQCGLWDNRVSGMVVCLIMCTWSCKCLLHLSNAYTHIHTPADITLSILPRGNETLAEGEEFRRLCTAHT